MSARLGSFLCGLFGLVLGALMVWLVGEMAWTFVQSFQGVSGVGIMVALSIPAFIIGVALWAMSDYSS